MMNRKIYRRLTASCLTLLIAGAPFVPSDAQKLSIQKLTIDCGKTGFEMPVTATFQVKNKGLKRLVINEVRPDCGCTTAEISRRELGAGDKATITLKYHAQMLGHYVKQAALYTNATTQPVYLTMKGVVVDELRDYSGTYPFAMGELLSDKNELMFDDVNKGDRPQMEVHILNNGERAMTPNVQHLPDYLTAEVVPEKLAPGRAGKVTLTLNSQLIHDYGLTQTTLYLASNLGDKISPDNELPVSIVLLPDMKRFDGVQKQYAPQMELSATELHLGIVDGKKQKNGTIVITNHGRTELSISSLQISARGLKVTLDKRVLQPGEQARLKVAADREVLLKQRSKPRVLMITNDPDRSKVIINVNVK